MHPLKTLPILGVLLVSTAVQAFEPITIELELDKTGTPRIQQKTTTDGRTCTAGTYDLENGGWASKNNTKLTEENDVPTVEYDYEGHKLIIKNVTRTNLQSRKPVESEGNITFRLNLRTHPYQKGSFEDEPAYSYNFKIEVPASVVENGGTITSTPEEIYYREPSYGKLIHPDYEMIYPRIERSFNTGSAMLSSPFIIQY